MSRFELRNLDEVRGRISFKKLVIDGDCQFDAFCSRIRRDGNLEKQLMGLINTMDQVANMRRLPRDKFRDITPSKEIVKEFEIKKGDLRVYVIKEEGHVVILGGKKGEQGEDIGLFRSIKRRYLEYKKQNL